MLAARAGMAAGVDACAFLLLSVQLMRCSAVLQKGALCFEIPVACQVVHPKSGGAECTASELRTSSGSQSQALNSSCRILCVPHMAPWNIGGAHALCSPPPERRACPLQAA